MARKAEIQFKPKVVFVAVGAACAFFCALLVLLNALLPAQDEFDDAKHYGYVYSGTKSASVAFNTAADNDGSTLLFGSSELSTPASVVPEVPSEVFGLHDYGIDVTYVGEAYDQSLWHTIAAGAYAPATDNRKVVIIVSPTWFEDGGVDNETFKLRFSYSLWRGFCSNPDVSQGTKDYVARRLVEQGIAPATVNAGLRSTPIDSINDCIFAFADDLRLRADLQSVREMGLTYSDASADAPSFEDLAEQAENYAREHSSNDWGMDDEFYAENIEGRLDRLSGTQGEEKLADTKEYTDFEHLLSVCNDVGYETLVVLAPMHGQFYDHAGLSKQTREECYSRIRAICEQQASAVADFTEKEYEPYFLHDIVHFGGPGWVAVEEAIYGYITED